MAGPIAIAVVADVAKARAGLNSVEGDLSGLGGKTSKFGAIAKAGFLAAGAAAVAFGVSAVRSASDAQQSVGATETVFGKFAAGVIKTSKAAAQQYGLSANEYRENANLLGALFKNQGVAQDQLGKKTESMIGQAADLAATFGGTTKEAVEALGSAFKGEFDPLEKYGISIKQSTINAELAARGQDKLTGAALKQAQQVATTDLIMKQAAASQGAFARESDTLAGQQQRLGAQWENIKATVGAALIPALTGLATAFNEQVLPAISAAWTWLSQKLGPVFATVRGYVDQLSAAFGGGGGGGLQHAIAVVQEVFGNVVATVAPIVQALIGLVRDNWSQIVAWTKQTFAQVRSTISSGLEAARTVVNTVLAVIRALWDRFGDTILANIKIVFTTIAGVIRGALNIVQGIFRTVTAVLKGDWSGAWNGIKQILSGALQVIVSLVRGVGGLLKNAATAAFGLLKDAVRAGISAAVDFVKSFPGKAVAALAGAGKALFGVGQNIVQGLINGLKSMAGSITSTLVGLLPGPLQKFAGKLGIHSPSTVFAEFGKFVGKGFVQGLQGTRAEVADTMDKLAGLIKESQVKGLDGLLADARARLLPLASEYDRLKAKLAEVSEAYKQYQTSTADAVLQTANVTGFAGENGTDFAGIVAGLKEAKDQARQWRDVIAELDKLGLNKASLGQIVAAGPEQGLDAALAIAEAGKRGVREINALQGQVAKLAKQAGTEAADALLREGRKVGSAIVQGLKDGVDQVERRMEGAAERIAAAIRNALAEATPPKVADKRDGNGDLADEMKRTRKAIEQLPRDYRMAERQGKK